MKRTDHPHYGEIIKTPDGKIVCHICGNAYTKLGSHVFQKHNMTSREYKEMFGLEVGRGLITEEHRQHLKSQVMRNYDKVVADNLIKGGAGTRYKVGGAGRPKSKLSEQTLRKLVYNFHIAKIQVHEH